jgi:hypothetical protein
MASLTIVCFDLFFFSFVETIVTSSSYLEMAVSHVYPQFTGSAACRSCQQEIDCALISELSFPRPTDRLAGPISWPARSPDVTTCFFFCGIRKTVVAGINNLKDRIQTAISTVDVDMSQRTWPELEYRLDIIRVTNGAHVKRLLCSEQTLRVRLSDDE